jgi:hypothetical protein
MFVGDAYLWQCGRRLAGAFFAPMIAAATMWFEISQPRHLPRLCGDGRSTNDRLAIRTLADFRLRLAAGNDDHRRRRLHPVFPATLLVAVLPKR